MKPDFTITKRPNGDDSDDNPQTIWELHYRGRKAGIIASSANVLKYAVIRARFLDKGILLPHMSATAWEVCINEAMANQRKAPR